MAATGGRDEQVAHVVLPPGPSRSSAPTLPTDASRRKVVCSAEV
jgi:hypothetical protein